MIERLIAAGIVILFVGAWLAFWVGVVYVGWHFIGKFW